MNKANSLFAWDASTSYNGQQQQKCQTETLCFFVLIVDLWIELRGNKFLALLRHAQFYKYLAICKRENVFDDPLFGCLIPLLYFLMDLNSFSLHGCVRWMEELGQLFEYRFVFTTL